MDKPSDTTAAQDCPGAEAVEQTDKSAGAKDAPPKVRGTVRQVRMGRELVAGAPSLRAAAVAAGYAETTASSPQRNGLTVPRLLSALEREEKVSLSTLEKKALKTLDTVLSNPDPGQTEASTAGGVLRMRREFGDEDTETFTTADHLSARRYVLQAIRVGIRWRDRYGLDGAMAKLDKASLRTLGMPLQDAPRSFDWPLTPYRPRTRE